MKRRRFMRIAAAGALALTGAPRLLVASRPVCRAPLRFIERWSWAMGQPVHLRLFHASDDGGHAAAQAVFAELRRIEARLSGFDGRSDLAELNRRAGLGWMRADRDLLAVLGAAETIRQASRGAFNCAVEPLMRVWGFREPRKRLPGVRELVEAREAVATATVDVEGDRVRLPASHTRLDFGGIAVGYGLDRAGLVLRAHGVDAALLDVSGDLLGLGAPPGMEGWPVDIVDPRREAGRLATATLRDTALATSANTVSVLQLAGRLIGHVMDPALGEPAHRIRQATVQASSGIAADALSTALLVSASPLPGVRRQWIV